MLCLLFCSRGLIRSGSLIYPSSVPLHRPCLLTRWRGCRCSTSPLCVTTSSVWKQTIGASPPRSHWTWPITVPRSDSVTKMTWLFEGKATQVHCYVNLRTWWCAVELFQRWGWTSRDPWRPNEARECRLPGSSLHSCFDKMVEGHMEVERVEDRGMERGQERRRERGSWPEV